MISREKCLEWAKASGILNDTDLHENNAWRADTIREIESLCRRAYAEGQKDMRERAAKVCDMFEQRADQLIDAIADAEDSNEGRSEYLIGKSVVASRIAVAIRALEIEP